MAKSDFSCVETFFFPDFAMAVRFSARAESQMVMGTGHYFIMQMHTVDERWSTAPMTAGTLLSSNDQVRLKAGCRHFVKPSFRAVCGTVLHTGHQLIGHMHPDDEFIV